MYIGWNLEKVVNSGRYYFWKEIEHRDNLILYGIPGVTTSIIPPYNRFNQKLNILAFSKIYPQIFRYNDIKNIRKIINQKKPDILVMGERLLSHLNYKKNIGMSIPKILIVNDIHNVLKRINNLATYIDENNIVLILTRLKYTIPILKKYLSVDIKWLPWSVQTNVFKDYGAPKKFDVFSSGAISGYYPTRKKIKSLGYHYQRYPIIPLFGSISQKGIRLDYAKQLSCSKIFLFTNSHLYFAIMKYFEGMASDCMVIAPTPNDSEDLGFISGKNFVGIDQNSLTNIRNEIIYYLGNKEERENIISCANETIQNRHTTEIRVSEFMDMIK